MGMQKMTASFVIIVRFCRKSMKRIWRRAWRNQKKSVPLQANRKTMLAKRNDCRQTHKAAGKSQAQAMTDKRIK